MWPNPRLLLFIGLACLLPLCVFYGGEVSAQFPTICIENCTLPNAVCCPTPVNATVPCGGKHRGKCRKILFSTDEKKNASRYGALNSTALQDDRVTWPSKFFESACDCSFNWDGPACDRCASGWSGPNCTKRAATKRIRRNVLSLTLEEKHLLRDVINASKYTESEWSVFSIANRLSADPVSKANLVPYKVSVYDFMVYLHFYAVRSTLVDPLSPTCDKGQNSLDFSHKGPGFLPWHRYYLLRFEEELIKIAESQFGVSNFSLSYWDWTGKNSCEVCTDDLMGGFENVNLGNETMDASDVDDIIRFDDATKISSNSPFSKWRLMCSDNRDASDCRMCDLESRESAEPDNYLMDAYLSRKYSTNPEHRLPTQLEVDQTMACAQYDSADYDEKAPNTSFRNCIEGFATLGSRPGPLNMNNLVRAYFNGSFLDVASSPNDPIFLLHHAFVDKLYNLWIISKNQTDRKFPSINTTFGHSGSENIVPSFPPVRLSRYATAATSLGYDYDDNLAGASPIAPASTKKPKVKALELIIAEKTAGSPLTVVLVALVSVGAVVVVVGGGWQWRQQRQKRRMFQYVPMAADDDTLSAMGAKKVATRLSSSHALGEAKSEKIPLLRVI